MMSRRRDLSKKDIVREYVKNKASLSGTARKFKCNIKTLKRNMALHGIAIIPGRQWGWRRGSFPQLRDKQWLKDQLESKTIMQIAKGLGTSHGNVADAVYRHRIRWRGKDRALSVKKALKKRYPHGRYGELAGNWRGGKRLTSGYVQIYNPQHPYSDANGYVMQHRLVVEKHQGRFLKPNEFVHHKNGNKRDNRLSNLEVIKEGDHIRKHFTAIKELEKWKNEAKRLRRKIRSLI